MLSVCFCTSNRFLNIKISSSYMLSVCFCMIYRSHNQKDRQLLNALYLFLCDLSFPQTGLCRDLLNTARAHLTRRACHPGSRYEDNIGGKKRKKRKEPASYRRNKPFVFFLLCVRVRVRVCVCACACVRVCACA